MYFSKKINFSEKIADAYTWTKTFYKTRLEIYPAMDYFFRGLNESIKLVSFLRPTVSATFTPLIKRAKVYFYPGSQSIEVKENALVQQERLSDSMHVEEKMKEWMDIPPLTASTSDSELMDITFLESFKLNTNYLSYVLMYYTFITPLMHPIIRFISYLQGSTTEEGYANADDITYGIDLLASIYFFRNVIDLLVQNQAFAKLIASIAKKHSPVSSHIAKCNEKKEMCAHLHSCQCPTNALSQADSDSSLYYFTYLTLVSTSAKVMFYMASGSHATAQILIYSQGNYFLFNKLLSVSNVFIKASSFAAIAGLVLEILAEGWCIGEYRLATIKTCTQHRNNHLKENYHYYMGVGIGSYCTNALINKPLTMITGLTGFKNIFISMPIAAFLFQAYIAVILKKQILFKKTSVDWPDVFYYHRKISDFAFKKISNYLILKLNDPTFRSFLAKFEIPFKMLLFILIKPSLRSFKLLAKKPAISLLFCWEKKNIDDYMYWVRMTQKLPNATTNYIAKAVSFAPSWLIRENISLLVGWAEKYGIDKLIKQIEEFLTLVQCEHPTMRANDGQFYSPLEVKENHSTALIHQPPSINTTSELSEDSKHQSQIVIPKKSISSLEKTPPRKGQEKKEDNNENEKWVWVNNATPLQQKSLFTYVSKFVPTPHLPTVTRAFRCITGY